MNNIIIDAALFERSKIGIPKLSPVMREIAPQAEQIFRGQKKIIFELCRKPA